MGGDGHFVDAVHVVEEIFDFGTEFGRQAVAGGVGDVDDGGSGLDYGLDHAGEIFIVGAAGVLGVKLHILHKPFGIAYGSDGALDDFLACGVEFVAYVRVGCADACVYTGMFGIFEGRRLPRGCRFRQRA